MSPLALAVLLAAAPAGDAAARLDAAGEAYRAGDFAAAARGWEALLAEGLESPTLHLNLGNARFRLGRRGAAIASYARALRLDPDDADARANLALARAANVDRLVGERPPPLLQRLAALVSDRVAVASFGAAWLVLWGALAAWRRAPGRARGALAAAAVLGAVGSVAAGLVLAGKAASARTAAAVVVAASSPVREAPEPALRPIFELHEGTELRVLEVRGETARVLLANGLEGWVAAGDLEVI